MIQQYGIEEAQVEEIFSLELLDENKDNTYVGYSMWVIYLD